MEKIVTYKTSDGQEFESEEYAQKHEDELAEYERNRHILHATKSGKKIGYKDIVEVFSVVSCHHCPFEKECNDMYNHIRCSTTRTFTLCDVIQGKLS